jgi:hypothetical protein
MTRRAVWNGHELSCDGQAGSDARTALIAALGFRPLPGAARAVDRLLAEPPLMR